MKDKVPSSYRGVRGAQLNRYASLTATLAVVSLSMLGCSTAATKSHSEYLETLRQLQVTETTGGASALTKKWVSKQLPADHRLSDAEIEQLQRDMAGCVENLANSVKVAPSDAARAIQLVRCMEKANWTYELREEFVLY